MVVLIPFPDFDQCAEELHLDDINDILEVIKATFLQKSFGSWIGHEDALTSYAFRLNREWFDNNDEEHSSMTAIRKSSNYDPEDPYILPPWFEDSEPFELNRKAILQRALKGNRRTFYDEDWT